MDRSQDPNCIYALYGRIAGQEFNYSPITKEEAKQMKEGRYNEFKTCLRPDDYMVFENKQTGNKNYFKPTASGLVQCRSYAWVITKDLMPQEGAKPGTNGNAVGLIGPRFGLPLTAEEIEKHPKAKKFRMLDDDKNVYYEGYFVDEFDRYTGFEPKDDFGEPNAGCTEIQFLEHGAWNTL